MGHMHASNLFDQPTDLPCPNCRAKMTARPYSRTQSLVWCGICAWNTAGTGKWLRVQNLSLFTRGLWLLPFAIPLVVLFHTLDPFVAYGLDFLLVIALFVPALMKSQSNVKLAGRFEALKAERPHAYRSEIWEPEPELAVSTPRSVRLSGRSEPVLAQLRLLRVLWAIIFVSGLLALTPASHVVGVRVQLAALMILALAFVPMLGVIGALLYVVWRHRGLAIHGTPCEGQVRFQMTHMRRLPAGGWTLVARYWYGFTDPHGTAREGSAREEGRAIVEGQVLTVLDSPRDPRIHASYPACLYAAAAESDGSKA